MGGRDYRHRETKKAKKGARPLTAEVLVPSAETEGARKRKAKKEKEPEA